MIAQVQLLFDGKIATAKNLKVSYTCPSISHNLWCLAVVTDVAPWEECDLALEGVSRNLVGISIYLCQPKQKKLSVCYSM